MATTVLQHDKRSGITYVYESISYWDKKKQQSRAKRKLIGKINQDTGEVEPTDGRGRKRKATTIPEYTPCIEASRSFYGAIYLLDAIGDKLGIENDLKQCFPDTYKQILSIVYYLILEDSTPLFRFEKWHKIHKHPYGENITSQRSSELFASVTESAKMDFFSLQGKRRSEKEFWAYDTTSISSYSKQLKQVQRGYNKEHDPLPQINLAMVFGEQSMLPFYYRKLAGNIPDSKTVKNLITELGELGFRKIKLVMDKGFYSKDNINMLYQDHVKFLIAAKISLKLIRQNLDGIYDNFRSFEHYYEERQIYAHTIKTWWSYEQERPYKKDIIKGKKKVYIHYYFNIAKATEEEQIFDGKLIALRKELLSGNRITEHEKLYDKYFYVKTTPKRGAKVTVKNDIVAQTKRYFGFFVLISNETMNAIDALETYRNKDLIEKAFGNLKERLNMRRALVSSEESLNGKLFVQFIALIYLSYIKKQMQNKQLFKKYTIQSALDQLDVIECFEVTGRKLRIGEVLEKQKQLYADLDIVPPSSL